MAKTKVELPKLSSNTTAEMCVDELGAVRERKSEAETLEKFWKSAMQARMTDEQKRKAVVQGDKYLATIDPSTRTTMNYDAMLTAHLGADWREQIEAAHSEGWLNQFVKVTEFDTIRTTKTGD